MRKSSKYWKQRFEQLEADSNANGVSTCSQIEPAFEQAQRQVNQEIEAWYGRFAENNELSIQEARKALSVSELKDFHCDVKEYIRYGQENAVDSLWIKELENASAKAHINRLEALKVRTRQAIEAAFGNEADAVDGMARKIFADTYYHSLFEMQKGTNQGRVVGQLDERALDQMIAKPWAADGKSFSDRIVQSKNQLIHEVHNELTRNCSLGQPPDDVIQHISKKFNISKSQAQRLVMTEEAYFHSAAQKEAFKDMGVEEYEIAATLDSSTSAICRSLDGKCFPMEEYAPGSTAPPFHPWCRTVTIPHVEDNLGNENGDTDYIPDNMSYEDWEKKYVVEPVSDKALYEEYKGVLRELSPESLEEFINIKYNNSAEWEQLESQYKTLNMYKIDSGDLSAQEILDLDRIILTEKRINFTSAYKKRGNIAGAYIGKDKDNIILAHSKINTSEQMSKYKGEGTIVGLTDNRQFSYINVVKENGKIRNQTYCDTEAKLFEWLAKQYEKTPFDEITMLSERGMCDSCLGVLKQFEEQYGVRVNAVSNKKVEGNVWKNRL